MPGLPPYARPVALAGGVEPEHEPVAEAVLEHPSQERQGAVVGVGRPAEGLVVLDEDAARQELAVVAAVDDLVGVREGDGAGRGRRRPSGGGPARGPRCPSVQWVRIGHPGRQVRGGGRLEDR